MATAPPQSELLPIYPQLSPQNFRFDLIATDKKYLEKEVDSNLALYKKYKKLSTAVVAVRYFFIFLSDMFNAAGIAALEATFFN